MKPTLRILWIEDEPGFRAEMQPLLGRFTTVMASTPSEAIGILSKMDIQVVITGYRHTFSEFSPLTGSDLVRWLVSRKYPLSHIVLFSNLDAADPILGSIRSLAQGNFPLSYVSKQDQTLLCALLEKLERETQHAL